jgi:energy-coupling factor transporter transmembrane protein EcfT
VIGGEATVFARRLAPPTRLIALVCASAVVIVCSPFRTCGLALILFVVGMEVAAFRPPAAVWRVLCAFGATFFLPWVLLAPLLPRFDTMPGSPSNLEIAGAISILGLLVLLTTLGAAGCFTQSDLREGLLGLRVPKLVVSVTLQVLQQSAHLVEETRRIRVALLLRNPSRSRHAGSLLVRGLTLVWIPRVFARVERVAAAMELRGYDGYVAPLSGGRPLRGSDYAVVVGSVLLVACAIVLKRFGFA